MTDVCFEIKSHGCLIRTSIFLLGSDEKNNRVEVGEIEMISTTENNIIIEAEVKPFRCIETQMMNYCIFLWILIIATLMLVDHLHKNILVVYFPYPRVDFQKKIWS